MNQLPFIMDFVLNLTYRCNLRCEMCTQYGDFFKENAYNDLDIEVWLKFLESIKDVTPKPKLILMGGEPLLYKDFSTLFLTAQKYGIKTHIITNGFYLEKYLSILKDTDTSITISLDGLFDIHDKIRGMKGLFSKVLNNIKEINELQKLGSKIELRINHVILPDNIDGIVDFYQYLKEFKIKTFTFQHLQFSSDELNEISQKEWKERLGFDYCNGLILQKKYILDKNYVDKIKSNFEKFKNLCESDNCFSFPALEDDELADYYSNHELEKLRTKRICTTPWMNPTIHPNGDISNCIGNIIGNLKYGDFWDIWNNKKAEKFRNCLVNNGKFTVCTKCCNFFKGNFIASNDSKLIVNGQKLKLPDNINYVQTSKRIAFIKDIEVKQVDDYIPVIPINIHTDETQKKLEEAYEVVTIIK